MMTDQIFDLDALLRPMTEEEIAEVYPNKDRRAPNFEAYQVKINATEIGSRVHATVPQTDEPEVAARALRYNLSEAAKERTVWKAVDLTEEEAALYAANKRIDRFDREDGSHVTRIKNEWRTQVKEPVVLRWKVETKEVDRSVTEDGKTTIKKVKVPVRMTYVVVATVEVRHRAARTPKPADAKPDEAPKEGETLPLPAPNGVPDEVPAAV
jgi:hypothetical protein